VNNPPDLHQILVALTQLGRTRPDQALSQAEAILERAPGLVPVLCLAGRLARLTGDLDRAGQHLDNALRADPEAPPALAEMGALAAMRGEYGRAVRCYRKLLDLGRSHADIWFNLAVAHERLGDFPAAAEAYRQALAATPSSTAEIRARLGGVLASDGLATEARAEYQRALAEDPESLDAHLGMGMMKVAEGDLEGARESFRRCLEIRPGCVEAWQQIIEIGRIRDPDDPDLASVRALMADADLASEDRERLGFTLGKACDDLGLYDEAFEHYREANALKRRRLPPFDRDGWSQEVNVRLGEPMPERESRQEDDQPTPVFIVGLPRSGTTLVDQILTSHPEAAGLGELPYFDRARVEYESSRAGYLEHMATTGSPTVTNKYPANFRHLPTICRLFPNARIVHVVRQALDTCLSIYFQDFPTGNLYANDLGDIASYYAGYLRLMEAWTGDGSGILEVRYEALLEDQEGVTRSLLDHCGLDWNPACLQFDENPAPVSTLSRWQVRQPLYTRSVGRWRHYEARLGILREALGELGDHN
jgi:tetratricopeptide (TPR) repeat protein